MPLRKRRVRRPIIKRPFVKRPCRFCTEHVETIHFTELERIGRYVTDRGQIMPARLSRICAGHQRLLTRAIKRARFMALLPYLSV